MNSLYSRVAGSWLLESRVVLSVDLDWANEHAIMQTIDFLKSADMPFTVFTTHDSPFIAAHLNELEVGIHPYFGVGSSHGATLDEVVRHTLALRHNTPAYRCHRFHISNDIAERFAAEGMLYSSNVCTDLEMLPPYRDRTGGMCFPIFLEDGAYLLRHHSLDFRSSCVGRLLLEPGLRVVVIHPMHFAVNTPNFRYMRRIKDSMSRQEWNGMPESVLRKLRNDSAGIGRFTMEMIAFIRQHDIRVCSLEEAYQQCLSALGPRSESSYPARRVPLQ